MRATVQAAPQKASAASAAKGLFLSCQGLPATIVESQVIVHVRDMGRAGFTMPAWVMALSGSAYREAAGRRKELEERYGIEIRLLRGVKSGLPVAELVNGLLFAWSLGRSGYRPAFVHARTESAALIAAVARVFFRFALIWDCRGDTVAELGSWYGSGSWKRLLRGPQRRLGQARVALARRLCDSAVFVSEALRERCYPGISKPHAIVPCAAPSDLFYFSPALRGEYRRRLGAAPDDKVILYSGSLADYQIFPEQVGLFRRMAQQDSGLRLLVLTPQQEQARALMGDLAPSRQWVKSVPIEEVNAYLNAADFGLLLRRPDAVNRVASPVKFAEYSLAGLPVIMSRGVAQATEIADRLGHGIYHDFQAVPGPLQMFPEAERARIAGAAAQLLSRDVTNRTYASLYEVAAATPRVYPKDIGAT